jgi:protein SCO1
MSETSAANDRGTATAPDPEPPGSSQPRRSRLFGRPRRSTVVLGVIALVSGIAFATVFAFVVTALTGHNRQPPLRTTGIPKTVSTKLANMMQLSPVPPAKAPGFTLTDQSGQPVSLASLHGRTVVLTFMDSHCTDICPIISHEFVVAHQQLGAAASSVAFVGINVNPFHLAQSDVASFTNEQGLNEIPEWHFLTGSVAQLQDAWKKYGVAVQAPNPNVDVVHSDDLYFIDSTGHQRWIAIPTEDHTAAGTAYLPAAQIRQWGVDIASVVRQMLG